MRPPGPPFEASSASIDARLAKWTSLVALVVYIILASALPSIHAGSPARSRGQERSPRLGQSTSGPGTSRFFSSGPIDGYSLADIVVVSGIDGSLSAFDRATGASRWTLGGDTLPRRSELDETLLRSRPGSSSYAFGPLVSAEYGRRRSSLAELVAESSNAEEHSHDGKEPHHPLDGLPDGTRQLLKDAGIYVVEPGPSGRLYLLTSPENGEGKSATSKAKLQKFPLTLPELVALSPFSFPGEKGRIFTGSKQTRLIRLDPLTGQMDATWGADGGELYDDVRGHTENEDEIRWAYLARTDYTLSISLPRRPHLSQTLHYSTYTPQSSDSEIESAWSQAFSDASANSDVTFADGQLIIPTDLYQEERGQARLSSWNATLGCMKPAWNREVPSQIVNVFDLLLPEVDKSQPLKHPVLVTHPPFGLAETGALSLLDGQSQPDSPSTGISHRPEDTLLTFASETGSLYALSSNRFPGVVGTVTPALASLEQQERESRSSNSLVPGSPEHHPLECPTFGCWLGTYHVDETKDDKQLMGPGGQRLGIDGRHDPPLGLPDRPSNSISSGNEQTKAQFRKLFELPKLPSKKTMALQAFGVLILAALVVLVRRGLRIQADLAEDNSRSAVSTLDLKWDRREEARSNGASIRPALESDSDSDAEPHTKTNVAVVAAEPISVATSSGPAASSVTPVSEPCDPEVVRAQLLAEEEQADKDAQSAAKKKRRRRGKRSGAAVRARQNGANGGANGDESGSDDEKAAEEGDTTADLGRSSVPIDEAQVEKRAKEIQKSPSVALQTNSVTFVAQDNSNELSALEITDEVLGYGSSGTVVFKGKFQSRLVAVKRLLVDFVHLASQEISLLESADDHPNVIRYFFKEQTGNFLFIALELCPASLADIVERPEEWKDLAIKLEPKKAVSQIASGLRHLHDLSIVHRDIKPQNILVAYANPHSPSSSSLKMMLSDFGLSKRLDTVAQSSFSQTMHHPGGTAGWRAPEILRGDVSLEESASNSPVTSLNSTNAAQLAANGSSGNNGRKNGTRITRAVDIFALGCLSYYILTSGDHPFGARYEREINIMRNQFNLARISSFGEEGHEASHLIQSMISSEPTKRPKAAQVLFHPYFWDAGKRLAFLQDVSDRIEVMEREREKERERLETERRMQSDESEWNEVTLPPIVVNEAKIILLLEAQAKEVTNGGDWTKSVDRPFMQDLGKWRKYHGHRVRDLLRALRNKKHHYQDMPPALRRSMGSLPDGFLAYFTRRFPRLFLTVYEAVYEEGIIRREETFKEYFSHDEGAL